jgi:hypothetical protein
MVRESIDLSRAIVEQAPQIFILDSGVLMVLWSTLLRLGLRPLRDVLNCYTFVWFDRRRRFSSNDDDVIACCVMV